jgi:hypothetical protein
VATAPPNSVQTEVLLSGTVLVGLLTTVSNNVGNTQQVTVGLNLAVATVTQVEAIVLLPPALDPVFTAALQSGQVLAALTSALRAVLPGQVQVKAAGLNLPIRVAPTYQPPGGSLFDPDILFETTFSVGRVVARPIDAATPGPGALAIGVDMVQPQSTNGDPSALVDLNTVPAPQGNIVSYEANGSSSFGGGTFGPHTSNAAVAVNGDWLSAVVNNVISPQLAGKFVNDFAKQQVAFRDIPNCIQMFFGTFTVPVEKPPNPPIPSGIAVNGITAQVKLTKFLYVVRDAKSYYHGTTKLVDLDLTAQAAALLQTFGYKPPSFPPPPTGSILETVSWSTDPPGGYFYVNGAPVVLGMGPYTYRSNELQGGQVQRFGQSPDVQIVERERADHG